MSLCCSSVSVGSESTLGARHVCPKIRVLKINKMPECLPENGRRLCDICPKMPKFSWHFPEIYFSPKFGGAYAALSPPLLHLYVHLSVLPCVCAWCMLPETLLKCYLEKHLTDFDQTHSNVALWARDNRFIFWPQKVKVQGHGGWKQHSTTRGLQYSLSRVDFWISSFSLEEKTPHLCEIADLNLSGNNTGFSQILCAVGLLCSLMFLVSNRSPVWERRPYTWPALF